MINTKFASPVMAEQWYLSLPDKYRLLYLHMVFKANSCGITTLDPLELKTISNEPLDFGHFLATINPNEERFLQLEGYNYLCKDYFRLTFGPEFNPRHNNEVGYLRFLIHHNLPLEILQVDIKGFARLSPKGLQDLALLKNRDILEEIFLTGNEALIEPNLPVPVKRSRKKENDTRKGSLSVEQMIQFATVFKIINDGGNLDPAQIEKVLETINNPTKKQITSQSIDTEKQIESQQNANKIASNLDLISTKVTLESELQASHNQVQSNGTVIKMPIRGQFNATSFAMQTNSNAMKDDVARQLIANNNAVNFGLISNQYAMPINLNVNDNEFKIKSKAFDNTIKSDIIANELQLNIESSASKRRQKTPDELRRDNMGRLHDFAFWCAMTYEEFCDNYPAEPIDEKYFIEYKEFYNKVVNGDPNLEFDLSLLLDRKGRQLSPTHWAKLRVENSIPIIMEAAFKIVDFLDKQNSYLLGDFNYAFKFIKKNMADPTYNVVTAEMLEEMKQDVENKKRYYYEAETATIFLNGEPTNMIDANNDEQIIKRYAEWIKPGEALEEFRRRPEFRRNNRFTLMNRPGEEDPTLIIKQYAATKK